MQFSEINRPGYLAGLESELPPGSCCEWPCRSDFADAVRKNVSCLERGGKLTCSSIDYEKVIPQAEKIYARYLEELKINAGHRLVERCHWKVRRAWKRLEETLASKTES